jgi:glycosyltransferase involved in cell wall biosynthesis
MIIGIAGPMTLSLLDCPFDKRSFPKGYPFPMTSFLINGILKRGYKVRVYTTSEGIKEPVIYDSDKLTICIGRREPHAARDFFKSERKDLVSLMNGYKADIINALWTYEFAMAALTTRLPSVITMHDHALTIFKYKTDPHRFMRLCMNSYVLHSAKHLLVNSQYLYNTLSRSIKEKARIIPNFYSESVESQFDSMREKQNFIVTIANGYGKRKNIDTAIKAFALIRNNQKDIEYYLLGDDMEQEGPAYEYARKNNLLDGIRFLGHQPFNVVLNYISKSKVMLHPAREESFGMSVLEAMVLGTAVVGGRESGYIPFLLDHGNAGCLCDVNNHKDIAEKVLSLLHNDTLRTETENNARRFAKDHYSEKVIVPQYISTYENILNKIL